MGTLRWTSADMAVLAACILFLQLFDFATGNTQLAGEDNGKKETSIEDERMRPGRVADALQRRGLSSPQPRIYGGWDTVEDRYAYAQVSLEHPSKGHQCGGSLVAPDVVLTAAHCSGTFNKAVVGKHTLYDPSDASETFGIAREIIHPNFDSETTRFDIMLLLLDGRSTLVQPVRINSDPLVPENGQALTVVGWGYDENWDLPETLQETVVTYTRNPECITLQDSTGVTLKGNLYGDMMCAGDSGRDSCYGE